MMLSNYIPNPSSRYEEDEKLKIEVKNICLGHFAIQGSEGLDLVRFLCHSY
jgi:hypothetical protein